MMTFDQLNNILIENCEKFEISKPTIMFIVAVFGVLIFNFLPFLISIFYGIFRLLFGTLYPAYASYKIVKSKDARHYVKWMMYWIVFAIFSSVETFTDIFVSWFPFYYELKVLILFWLLSPATNGSSFLYRKFIHPVLSHHENEIDEHISTIKERGYDTILRFGSRLLHLATNLIVQTAVKNLPNIALDPESLRTTAIQAEPQSETDSVHGNNIHNNEQEQIEIQSYDSDVSDDYSDRRSVDKLLIDDEDCSSKTRKKSRTRSQPHRRTKKRTVN